MLTTRRAVRLGQLVRLRAVDATLRREEQQPVVRGRHEEVLDDVVLLELGTLDALAAALLRAVQVGARALGVTGLGDGDDDVLACDEVLVVDIAVGRDEPRATLVAVLVDDLLQLVADDGALPLRTGQDVLVVLDLALDLGEVVDDLLTLEGSEATQLHRQDGVGLDLVDREQLDQAGARDVDGLRRADERDDLVERVESLDQAAQDVGAFLGLAQQVPRTPDDDLDLVVDVQPDHLVEAQRARHSVDDRQHVAAEARLQLRVLVEIVENHLGHRVAADGDDDAHAHAVGRLVVDVGDARDLAVADLLGDRRDEVVRVDHVGSSVMTMLVRPLESSSISTTPRIFTDPRPVV